MKMKLQLSIVILNIGLVPRSNKDEVLLIFLKLEFFIKIVDYVTVEGMLKIPDAGQPTTKF